MAIIREYVSDNGIMVRIADDCCWPDAERAWRRAQANRTILEVFAEAYLRKQRRCAEAREENAR